MGHAENNEASQKYPLGTKHLTSVHFSCFMTILSHFGFITFSMTLMHLAVQRLCNGIEIFPPLWCFSVREGSIGCATSHMIIKMEDKEEVENIARENKVSDSAESNDDLLLKLGRDYAQYMNIDIKKQVGSFSINYG